MTLREHLPYIIGFVLVALALAALKAGVLA